MNAVIYGTSTDPASLGDPDTVPQVNVVALLGGVGGAKLASGLAQLLPPERLTFVVNTADDFEHLGLHISPDLDTVMYTLAGLVNPETGWGVKDDTWNTLAMLAHYKAPTWFRLGDRDLATHLLRTQWLREGFSLNQVTQRLCSLLGVRQRVLPMSDAPVRTWVLTDEGEMAFQEYFVRRAWQPRVRAIRFEGIEQAQPTSAVMNALADADVILFGPSNPFVSLDPILALPEVRDILSAVRAPRVAISPIVAGQALKGPAAKMMHELNLEVSPVTVAAHYRDVLTGFVLDHRDAAYATTITAQMGICTLVTDIVMHDALARARLAREILQFALQQ
ncbi:MAG: 2-phospho-L-lactate transferase [Anaerolineae bacterium]|nr:2-phospho-L-lactate transferase [Anaerolineae bacterium]MDW8070624.1 2-phospho-L-lactate transferase [Anaerolineae bacterium]